MSPRALRLLFLRLLSKSFTACKYLLRAAARRNFAACDTTIYPRYLTFFLKISIIQPNDATARWSKKRKKALQYLYSAATTVTPFTERQAVKHRYRRELACFDGELRIISLRAVHCALSESIGTFEGRY